MFYRRKLIMSILEVFGGNLGKINLQKILFLVTNRQAKPVYEFIPYKYGSYSYSANADLTAMVKHGFISEDTTSFAKKDQPSYLKSLTEVDQNLVKQVYGLYKDTDADGLMKHTYLHYPYYAINSLKAKELLSPEEMEKVSASSPKGNDTILFTIGYEGISLEAYLNRLIKNDVKVLVDVRNNPLSQKYGFSKSQLIRFCDNLNIEYRHFPEVGIQSAERKELKDQHDYDELFCGYRERTLATTGSTQQLILDLLKEKKRIALTCFEANICQCHRKHLAESITHLAGWHYSLKHI